MRDKNRKVRSFSGKKGNKKMCLERCGFNGPCVATVATKPIIIVGSAQQGYMHHQEIHMQEYYNHQSSSSIHRSPSRPLIGSSFMTVPSHVYSTATIQQSPQVMQVPVPVEVPVPVPVPVPTPIPTPVTVTTPTIMMDGVASPHHHHQNIYAEHQIQHGKKTCKKCGKHKFGFGSSSNLVNCCCCEDLEKKKKKHLFEIKLF